MNEKIDLGQPMKMEVKWRGFLPCPGLAEFLKQHQADNCAAAKLPADQSATQSPDVQRIPDQK